MADNNPPEKLRCRICNKDVDAEIIEDHVNTVHNFANHVLNNFVRSISLTEFITVCFFLYCNFGSNASTKTKMGIVMAFGVMRITASIFVEYKTNKGEKMKTCPFCNATGRGNLVEHIKKHHLHQMLPKSKKTKGKLETSSQTIESGHERRKLFVDEADTEVKHPKREENDEKSNDEVENGEKSNDEVENGEKSSNSVENIEDIGDGEANRSNGTCAEPNRQEHGEKSDEEKYYSGEADSSSDAASIEGSVGSVAPSFISSGRRSSLQSLAESIILSTSSESPSRLTPDLLK